MGHQLSYYNLDTNTTIEREKTQKMYSYSTILIVIDSSNTILQFTK